MWRLWAMRQRAKPQLLRQCSILQALLKEWARLPTVTPFLTVTLKRKREESAFHHLLCSLHIKMQSLILLTLPVFLTLQWALTRACVRQTAQLWLYPLARAWRQAPKRHLKMRAKREWLDLLLPQKWMTTGQIFIRRLTALLQNSAQQCARLWFLLSAAARLQAITI